MSQNYQIEESEFGFLVKDNNGSLLFDDDFAQVFECSDAPGFLISTVDFEFFYVLDTRTKKKTRLFEYENDLKLDEVCRLKSGDYIRYFENKKIGLLKFPDSVVIEAEYKMIYPFQNYPYACILQKGKKYAHYNYITGHLSDWFDIYMKDDYMGFDDYRSYMEDFVSFYTITAKEIKVMRIDGTAYTLLNAKPKQFELQDDCMLPVKQGNLCGYVNDRGELRIPFIYQDAGPFVMDCMIAYVKKDGKYGYINSSGEVLIPFIYDFAESFIDGFAKVMSGQNEFYIDEEGKKKQY
jgi:hypothetical protein